MQSFIEDSVFINMNLPAKVLLKIIFLLMRMCLQGFIEDFICINTYKDFINIVMSVWHSQQNTMRDYSICRL
jgi:hypothetical protein